jgi:hypothetical protein
MATILIIVSAFSVATAVAMGLLVVKLLRDERRRSEARIAMLSSLAANQLESTPSERPAVELPAATERDVPPPERPVPVVEPWPAEVEQFETQPGETAEMFARPEATSPWPRRAGVAAALALAVFAAGFFALSDDTATTGSLPPQAKNAAGVPAAPLELMSLRHTQQRDSITITGLVQNPRIGPPLSGVTATVFLFGPDGTFLASGRAGLDFTHLGSGDESPFVIQVPVTGTVARYRVGFRGQDGRVLAHVDRRGTGALAKQEAGS